jgi:hypothetical protein
MTRWNAPPKSPLHGHAAFLNNSKNLILPDRITDERHNKLHRRYLLFSGLLSMRMLQIMDQGEACTE